MKNDIAGIQQEVQSAIWSRGVIGNYQIVRKIGEGSFSSVFLAVHVMTRHEVVLKSADKSQLNLASEIANMSLLSHPHIVRLYEYIVMPDKVWLVLEYCGGEELFNHLVMSKVILPSHACKMFAQLAGAVAYAHQLHCAHRDLKLENVLLDDDGNIKLGDFGFTRSYVPRMMLETVCGTESYMAPELLLHQKYNPEAADVWSLGVILYALIYGKLPFDEDNTAETVKKIVEEDPPFPPVSKGEYLVEISRKMLRKQPSQRPKVVEMLDELKEPGKQQKQLLAKITNHPESSYIFSSREERTVLKGMKALSIDLHTMASSIVNHKCDALHGLWYTALDRQRYLSKVASESGNTSASSVLHRRKSKTSIRSAKSHMSQKKHRSASAARQENWGDVTIDTAAAEISLRNENESEYEGTILTQISVAQSPLQQNGQASQHQQQQQQQQQHQQQQQPSQDQQLAPHQAQPQSQDQHLAAPHQAQQLSQQEDQSDPSLQPIKSQQSVADTDGSGSVGTREEKMSVQTRINDFIDRRSTGKSRRAMEKIISALKIKRRSGHETLMAYYKPGIENSKPAAIPPPAISDTKSGLSRASSRSGGMHTNHQIPSINSSSYAYRKMNSPVLDLGRSSPPESRRQSVLSIASSASMSLTETPVKATTSAHPYGSNTSNGMSTSASSLPLNLNQNTLQSSSSQTGTNLGTTSNAVSRQMSTYSQISQVSQLSQSSVEPSLLLADANESPKSNTRATNTSSPMPFSGPRWSNSNANSGSSSHNAAWKFAGVAQPISSTSTPPGTPVIARSRAGRLVSVKEKIPSKIDEGEDEDDW